MAQINMKQEAVIKSVVNELPPAQIVPPLNSMLTSVNKTKIIAIKKR